MARPTINSLTKTSNSISLNVYYPYTSAGVVTVGVGFTIAEVLSRTVTQSPNLLNNPRSHDVYLSQNLVSNTQYGLLCWGVGEGEEGAILVDGTLPAPPLSAQSLSLVGEDFANISFTTAADGGYYIKELQYSADGGITWKTGATVSAGGATSGVMNVVNLAPNTYYTVATRIATAAGVTGGLSFSFRTESKEHKGLLGSLNEKAKPITKFYGSVGGQSKRVKFYGSVGGQTKFIQ